MKKMVERIIINGTEIRVIVGPKGGGYIQLSDLCDALFLNYRYTLRKFRKDPDFMRNMSKQIGFRSDGSRFPVWCVSLRRVLEEFYGRGPISRITKSPITRQDLLRGYGFTRKRPPEYFQK